MKKYFNLNSIVFLVIGLILGGFVAYAAGTSYTSDQILYNKGSEPSVLTTVIEDIYEQINYGDATADDILEGKTCLVQGRKITGTGEIGGDSADTKYAIYVGQGTSFDLKSYNGYQNFTNSNFLVEPIGFNETRTSGTVYLENDLWAGVQFTLVKSYNTSTGILTAYGSATGEAGYDNSGYRHTERSITNNAQVKLYLLLDKAQNTALGGNYTRNKVVYLGQGQTFNLNEYDYANGNYTNDSFIVEPVNISKSQTPGTVSFDNDLWAGVRYIVSKSYNTSNKVFSTYEQAIGTAGYDNSGYRYAVTSQQVKADMKVYLIIN